MPPVSTETRGRKLHLPDDVHDRLWQPARQRRQTVSTVAAEIIDRNLLRARRRPIGAGSLDRGALATRGTRRDQPG